MMIGKEYYLSQRKADGNIDGDVGFRIALYVK